MKFILSIEENGYELRYWDEINEEIGEMLISSWNIREVCNKLSDMNFSLDTRIMKAIERLLEDRHFILLCENKTERSLFHKRLEVV